MSQPRPIKLTWIALLIAGVVVASIVIGFLRPPPSPPPGLVEPRLLALREPFQSVKSSLFTDGGSIGIRISDANGRTEEFALPNHLGSSENRQRVFVGAIYDRRPGAVEVAHSAETRQALAVILFRYAHGDPQLDAATAILSRRPTDFCKLWMHKLAGHYDFH